MYSDSDYLRRQAEEAASLARAEKEAIAGGNEPFDLAKFEELLGRGPMRTREQAHRAFYYFNRGARTLAEYVAQVQAQTLFDDS